MTTSEIYTWVMYILGIITEIFKAGTFRCRKRHPTPAPRVVVEGPDPSLFEG
jgi:hypothetical protein